MARTDAPSEKAIESAIEARIGSAGFFQVIAEEVARGIYPNLAPSLVAFGRRTDQKTVAGWPDAYLTTAQGKIIAVEATTASSALDVHWFEDLEKLALCILPGRRGGLVWIAWCKSPSQAKMLEMREAAAALGIPTEDITVLCRRELCARLRNPVHAQFLARDLGLGIVPGPFRPVEDVIIQMTMRLERGIFPTLDEYRANNVGAPAVLQELEATLVEQRAALVVGHGAAGKTTLAFLLAHRPHYRNTSRYYLDLGKAGAENLQSMHVAEAMAVFAGPGVLFLIDNAHLEPALAADILACWERLGRGSHLAIFTRRVRARAESWNDQPTLEGSSMSRLDLVIGPNDLEGVYCRHFRTAYGAEAPKPTPQAVRRWIDIFGGDLMSFSAAVLSCMERDPTCLTIEATDARAFVRDRYLEDPKLGLEVPALLDLAAIAEVESELPLDALPASALKNAMGSGLVWIEPGSLFGVPELAYRLAHPGLGTLLREAAGVANRSAADRARLLVGRPELGMSVARKLLTAGKLDEACNLLRSLWTETSWPLSQVQLSSWQYYLRLTLRLDVLEPAAIADRAASWLEDARSVALLKELVFAVECPNLVSLLETIRPHIPALHAAVSALLLADTRRSLDIFRTGFGGTSIRRLLIHLRLHMPTLEQELVTDIAANIGGFVDETISTGQVWVIRDLLDYLSEQHPTIVTDIHDYLASKSERICEAATTAPLERLAGFLTYIHHEIPTLRSAICDRLEANPSELGLRAIQTPPQLLPKLLSFAAAHRPKIGFIVRQRLIADATIVVRALIQVPSAHAIAFLESASVHVPTVAELGWRALESDLDLLSTKLLEGRLGDLLFVLSTIRRLRPQLVDRFVEGIANRPAALVAVTLASPLDQLGPLLTDESAEAVILRHAIAEGFLAAPQAFIDKALDAPPDQFACFVSFARFTNPRLAEMVNEAIELLDEEKVAKVAYRFIIGGPGAINAACRQAPASKRILQSIDAAQWRQQWERVHHGDPTWFRGFRFLCQEVNRMDLVGITAGVILRTARKSDFPIQTVTLTQLTHILTSPHSCDASEIETFFRERLPPDWLEKNFRGEARLSMLASSVGAMALQENSDLCAPFRLPSLSRRADAEWSEAAGSGSGLAHWMQLLFAIRLLGLKPPRIPAALTPFQIFGALEAHRPEGDRVKQVHTAVWGGLYEWCHLNRASCTVSPQLGQEMLVALESTADANFRWEAVNATLIDWLETGSKGGWSLAPATVGLSEAINRQIDAVA